MFIIWIKLIYTNFRFYWNFNSFKRKII